MGRESKNINFTASIQNVVKEKWWQRSKDFGLGELKV